MKINPITAIENAELEAQQVILKANAEKIKIVQDAKETAYKQTTMLVKKAELEAEKNIYRGRQTSAEQRQLAQGELENNLNEFKNQGKNKQEAAVKAVLDLLPNLL